MAVASVQDILKMCRNLQSKVDKLEKQVAVCLELVNKKSSVKKELPDVPVPKGPISDESENGNKKSGRTKLQK